MYRKILFGMDHQGQAAQAVPVVTALAKTSGAEVMVLHVRDASLDLLPAKAAERQVEATVQRLIEAGVSARGEIVRTYDPEPIDQIAVGAHDLGADLVALGSHGRTHIGGLLLGSVSHGVAARVNVPILMVHTQPRDDAPALPGPIQRVMVAVDGSERANAALAAAAELAGDQGAAVLAVHAREIGYFGGSFAYVEEDPAVSDLLERAAARLGAPGRQVETRTLSSEKPTADRIVEAANGWDADVIVLGSRRLTDIGGLLLGSVAHDVVRRTSRPVLLAERIHAHAR